MLGRRWLTLPLGRSQPTPTKQLPPKRITTEQASKDFLEAIAPSLNVKKLEDWYKIKTSQAKALSLIGKKLNIILPRLYPHHKWHLWRFQDKVPNGFWNEPANGRAFLDNLMAELEMPNMDGWYNISRETIVNAHGRGFLASYEESLSIALQRLYPDHEWVAWNFNTVPTHFWNKLDNQLQFVSHAEGLLGIKTPADWYKVSRQKFEDIGGRALLVKHNDSLIKVLFKVYPTHAWQEWKFAFCPQGFWTPIENQKRFLDSFMKEQGMKSLHDWYKMDNSGVMSRGGYALIQKYRGSLSATLRAVYPEHAWEDVRFGAVPKRTWESFDARIKKIEAIGRDLGVQKLDDWYAITRAQVRQAGGSGLLEYHNSSLIKCLQALYPTHEWLEWKFSTVTSMFWADISNQRKYFVWLKNEIGIKQYSDWYDVDVNVLKKHRGLSLIRIYYKNSMEAALRAVFPEHTWVSFKFTKQPRKWTVSTDGNQ